MIKKFQVDLMTEEFKYQTRTLEGAKGIVISWEQDFTFDELLAIQERAIKIEKIKFGYDVYFKDGGAIKKVHTRDPHIEYMNTSIKKKDTPESHLKRIYGIERDDEQLELL